MSFCSRREDSTTAGEVRPAATHARELSRAGQWGAPGAPTKSPLQQSPRSGSRTRPRSRRRPGGCGLMRAGVFPQSACQYFPDLAAKTELREESCLARSVAMQRVQQVTSPRCWPWVTRFVSLVPGPGPMIRGRVTRSGPNPILIFLEPLAALAGCRYLVATGEGSHSR